MHRTLEPADEMAEAISSSASFGAAPVATVAAADVHTADLRSGLSEDANEEGSLETRSMSYVHAMESVSCPHINPEIGGGVEPTPTATRVDEDAPMPRAVRSLFHQHHFFVHWVDIDVPLVDSCYWLLSMIFNIDSLSSCL